MGSTTRPGSELELASRDRSARDTSFEPYKIQKKNLGRIVETIWSHSQQHRQHEYGNPEKDRRTKLVVVVVPQQDVEGSTLRKDSQENEFVFQALDRKHSR